MTDEIVATKKFTDWMNEGFHGKYNKHDPSISHQMTRQLELANGVILSIQASWGHYCSPRENSPTGDYDYYDTFEIGFPSSQLSEEFTEYAEDPDNLTGTVYAWVPKGLIQSYITSVGGVVGIIIPDAGVTK